MKTLNDNPYLTDSGIQVYRKGSPVEGASYESATQDVYEVLIADYKYDAITYALENRIESGNRCFFIDQFNACEWGETPIDDGYFFSWPVICFINDYVGQKLSSDELEIYFRQPLGVVYFDMCGVEKYDDDNKFHGDTMTPILWKHNFRGFWDVSYGPKQKPGKIERHNL